MPSDHDADVIATLSHHLKVLPDCKRLEEVPTEFATRYTHCWRIPVHFSSATYQLLILLDLNFPFSFPRIAVENGPPLLSWPHLEQNGLLCVLPSEASGDWTKPNQLVDFVLGQAVKLIEHNLNNDTQEEFRDEFLSYWDHACEAHSIRGVSLVEPSGPSRPVYVYTGMSNWYFGQTEAQLVTWLKHKRVLFQKRIAIQKAWLLWLDSPWVPNNYPSSPANLLTLLHTHTDIIPLELLAESAVDGLTVLVGMSTPNGVCFAGIRHYKPAATKQGPQRHSGDPVSIGFRPGSVPPVLSLQRSMGPSSRVKKMFISRGDHRWIHGRDQDTSEYQLKSCHVCIIGVGSLGSEVAMLLAKSGLGKITLIDGEKLEWANISRHALGAEYIGNNKANAMKDYLLRSLPHISVTSISLNLPRSKSTTLDAAFKTDLVLMLTGDWAATSWLNTAWLKAHKSVPLITAWMEAHALATHSVHLSKNSKSGCLECGFLPHGQPKLPVFHFRTNPTLNIPACGGSFVPYGAVALSRAAGIVAEHTISALLEPNETAEHTISICSNYLRKKLDAEWSNEWINSEGDPGEGDTVVRRTWPISSTCSHCRTTGAQ